jgi:hypothetical protein
MKVYRIAVGGKVCVMEDIGDIMNDIKLMLTEEESQPITVQLIEMSEEEFDKLPEFEGY